MYIIKNDYIEKSMTILGDTTTFKKLDKDPTRTRENRFYAILLKMKKEDEITDEQCNQREQSLENFMDC